eukprot:SAG31_NODE_843_length_11551_cov_6.757772_12_plen_167_part_00
MRLCVSCALHYRVWYGVSSATRHFFGPQGRRVCSLAVDSMPLCLPMIDFSMHSWTVRYSYRLCPAESTLDEDCFNKVPVKMVGQSKLRWGGVGGRELPFDPVTVTKGTKAGVMWRKNPIPRAWKTKDGKWGKGSNHLQTGMGFQPICEDDGMDKQGTKQSCTGEWG